MVTFIKAAVAAAVKARKAAAAAMTSRRLKAENAAAPSRRTMRKAAAVALTKRLSLDRESLKFLKPPFVAEAFLRLVDSRGKSVGRVDLRVDRGH